MVNIQITTTAIAEGTQVILAQKGWQATTIATDNQDYINHAIKVSGFKERGSDALTLIPMGGEYKKIIIIPVSKEEKTKEYHRNLGGNVYDAIKNEEQATLHLIGTTEQMANTILGIALKSFQFKDHWNTTKEKKSHKIKTITINSTDTTLEKLYKETYNPLAEGMHWARAIVSTPSNHKPPHVMAQHCKTLEKLGVVVNIMEQDDLKAMGANLILSVGQGSIHPPCLASLEYKGGNNNDAPIVLVGKGITFDTGGYALKPADGMEEMITDLGGAAAVLGIIKAIAMAKLPIHVVGIMPFAENMVSGSAVKPGDIVQSLSGKTVEIINPDAEGRLVLADSLYYAHTTYKPKLLIDMATLTGAARVALGSCYAPMFATSDALSQSIIESGKETGEKVWRLPMGDEYNDMLTSQHADVRNIPMAREGGTIAGAMFLREFVGETPWIHLDIANVEWIKKSSPLAEKGATGFGVALLYDFLMKS